MTGTETAPAQDPQWIERYHRALLSHLGVDVEGVDLSTVSATSSWEKAWSYSEYTGGDAQFALLVTWRTRTPQYPHTKPDWDGLFTCSSELSNEEVAEFLNSLTGP